MGIHNLTAEQLHLKSKDELVQMLTKADRLERSMKACKTTVLFEIEGGSDFDLKEMLSDDTYNNTLGFTQFYAHSKWGVVQHAVLQVRNKDRASALACAAELLEWTEGSNDSEYISSTITWA